jgi:hypothetical protein
MDIATISVLATAAVSILSVLVPVALEHYRARRENAKRKEDRKLENLLSIERAAIDILDLLPYFNIDRWQTTEVEGMGETLSKAGKAVNRPHAISLLQSRFYIWEIKIWRSLDTETREQVRKLRNKIERITYDDGNAGIDPKDIPNEVPKVAEEVLTITIYAAKLLDNNHQK